MVRKAAIIVFVSGVSVVFAQLWDVHFFAYQLQMLDEYGAVDSLANSRYDMLVLEPTRTDRDCIDFDAREMVSTMTPVGVGGIIHLDDFHNSL